MLARDNLEAVEWGEKAAELAEQFHDVETRAMALNMTGTAYVVAGEIELGCGYLQRSLTLARQHELDYRTGSALSMLGTALGEMYELESSERFLREHIAYAEEHDLESSYTRSWLALALAYQGRWDEGASAAREVLDGHVGAISRITALLALARIRARRGDPGVRRRTWWRRSSFHVLVDISNGWDPVHAAHAEAAWLAGDGEPRPPNEASAGVSALALEKQHPWFAGELAYWQWKANGDLRARPEWSRSRTGCS